MRDGGQFLWREAGPLRDQLVAVLRPAKLGDTTALIEQLARQNLKLPDYKRLGAYLVTADEFPRTASMKVKRDELARGLRDTYGPDACQAL